MRSDSRKKEDGMDAANGVLVTYSRVTPASLEPPAETRPRGPLLDAVEVPHVRGEGRSPSGIDPVSLDGIVPEAVAPAAPRKRNRSLGRVVLLGVVALAAGVGILAATYTTAMRTAPQKGTPPASAAVGTAPSAATPASVPAAAPPPASAAVPARPDFSSATIGPQPGPRPAGSATVGPASTGPATASAPQAPAPKARPEQSGKAVAPAPAPAATPQASPQAQPQPQPGNGEFTANIERLLSRPVGDPTPPVAALPQNPVVVVPNAPPVAALPDGPVIGAAEPLPLPMPQVPPANIGAAPGARLVPPADIPNMPPVGAGGGLPALR